MRCCHKRYVESGSIAKQQGSGRPTLHNGALLQTIEDIMKLTTRLLQFKYFPTCCSEARGCYHSTRFCMPDVNWVGRTEGQRTAKFFVRQTKRNALIGLVLTFMMFCGQMNHLYSYSATKDFAAERRVSSPAQSPVPSIPSRCMYGLESDGMELLKSALLMA